MRSLQQVAVILKVFEAVLGDCFFACLLCFLIFPMWPWYVWVTAVVGFLLRLVFMLLLLVVGKDYIGQSSVSVKDVLPLPLQTKLKRGLEAT